MKQASDLVLLFMFSVVAVISALALVIPIFWLAIDFISLRDEASAQTLDVPDTDACYNKGAHWFLKFLTREALYLTHTKKEFQSTKKLKRHFGSPLRPNQLFVRSFCLPLPHI